MVVKSYFDGSVVANKSITLASIAADEVTWGELESRWEEVRVARGNPLYVHMTDLMALPMRGIYKEWSRDDRDYLMDGVLNALLSFRGNPNMFSFTCSINLRDYDGVRSEKRLPVPERMCARMVFPHVVEWYSKLPRVDIGKLEACFDRGEKFMRHIEQDWTNKQVRDRYPGWEVVGSINQAIMEKTPPLQITDVAAWGRNRLAAGSHWDIDPHYATAVRACGSLYSVHRPIDKDGLKNFHWREEGYAAIDPQRKQREEAADKKFTSEEFKRFDQMMKRKLIVEEQAAKKRKK
jgi:hypothetical protein